MAPKRIVVVGYVLLLVGCEYMSDIDRSAGVAGLTTAFLLSKKPWYEIVVAAKHMPGDYDVEYASPWAGANYMP